jgi:tRNA G18 (ribose-2'-O)-methylase SpoU
MKIVVVLHDVRSVHNVGSIFRTADAAGVAKIFLCGITPSPLDRFKNIRSDFAKVSLGAEKSVAWEYCATAVNALATLQADGYQIFAVEQSKKSIPYYAARSKRSHGENIQPHRALKIALVLGNEVKGLSPAMVKMADKILEIPMSGKKESLNVAVAFGIVVFGIQY